MAEHRKNQILQEFRRPPGNKPSRSRDIKARLNHLRSKETFLTDTQTSDYTKSSGEIHLPRIEQLEETIRKLQKENMELKQRIIQLKANQCFEINEEKLKSMIRQTDKLRLEVQKTKQELDQSLVERDFLERFNKNLKTQCEALTKEILLLKANSNGQFKKQDKNIYTSREDQNSNRSRNGSIETGKASSKRKQFNQWRRDKEDKEKESNPLLKASLSASRLHQDYYGGRSSRARLFKNH